MVKRQVYCDVCERNVTLKRKNFDHQYHEVIVLLIIFTLGIAYLILKYTKKKNTCPHCEKEFDLDNLPPPKLELVNLKS
ncbi:MAG: hypothetical protein GF383_08370 [Candidatus Lokiarchaeota archaeon]|nr:hypothetical protein [Candidatus Lokiarchaeota archaeon]MBD3340368.1 hypothetical protein [Candidatus Lokiarchaeota archaeon]